MPVKWYKNRGSNEYKLGAQFYRKCVLSSLDKFFEFSFLFKISKLSQYFIPVTYVRMRTESGDRGEQRQFPPQKENRFKRHRYLSPCHYQFMSNRR